MLKVRPAYPGEEHQEVFKTQSMDDLASSPKPDAHSSQSKRSKDPDDDDEPRASILFVDFWRY